MNSFLSNLAKSIHYALKLLVAVPLLLAIGIAAPASTREAEPVEAGEVEEEQQTPHTLTPPEFNWQSNAGAAPNYRDLTPGLTNPAATGAYLMDAVRNVHARRTEDKLSFAETFKELAQEIRGELPPQFEDKGTQEANESSQMDPQTETDRPRRRFMPKPKGRLPK